MKKLILALALTFMMSSVVLASETRCDIANLKACVLNLDSNEVMIGVHNSGISYQGIQLYTNQNHGLSMEMVFNDIDVLIEGVPAEVKIFRNVASVSASTGTLPPLFIVNLRLISKTSETISEIISRNTNSGSDGESMLIAVPILVSN